MPRQPRSLLPDGMFHVTARAGFGQPLFVDDDDRRVFLWMLRRLARWFELDLPAYVLMGTHYHLLLEGSAQALASMMQRLNGGYAHHFNARHGRHGHVFGDRYVARPVRDEAHLEELWRYLESNPVKAKLCLPGES